MTFNSKGSVVGLLVAGVSVIALMATVIGVINNNTRTNSQASLNSTGVMLQEGTLDVERIDDRHIEINGKICYSRHLQTGGGENWTLWVTDDRGKYLDGEGDTSDHIDGGRLSVGPSFPGTCTYTNEETGEGVMRDQNTKQPQRFSVIATTTRRLSASYCPEIYLQYRGTWFSGTPFAKIKLSNFSDVCGPGTPSPTQEPTNPGSPTAPIDPTHTPAVGAPTATATPPSTGGATVTPSVTPIPPTEAPTATPTPKNTITGRVSVYACKKPSRTGVEFCTGESCIDIKSTPLTTGPVEHGIWLNDTNDDSTWVYDYSIAVDEDEKPLDPTKTYLLPRALGWFDNDTVFIDSEREQGEKLRVKAGQKRDFKVYATRTCGCPFDTVSYLKDTSGNILTELDNKPGQYGTANNKQRFDFGDSPVASHPFNNLGNNPGRIEFHLTDLGDFRDARTWGRDALAAVKLYAEGWRVVKQECTSKNADVPGCPGYEASWSQTDMGKLRDPKVFEGLRVACGVNLEYGWVIEKIPPSPTPAPQKPDPFTVACSLRDDANAAAAQNEGCKPQNFRIKQIKEGTANLEWDVAPGCPTFSEGKDRYWIIVKKKNTNQIVASRRGMKDESTGVGANDHNPGVPPHQISVEPEYVTRSNGKKEYYYFEDQQYTAYLYAFLDKDASCMSNPVSIDFTGVKRTNSEEPRGSDQPGTPPSGGVCPQWCASEDLCRSQGYVPKDIPAGELCSGAGERWCCPPGTEPPAGNGNPGAPGQPGDPGNPGDPGFPGGGNPGGGTGGSCPVGTSGNEWDNNTPFVDTIVDVNGNRVSVCSDNFPGTSPFSFGDGFCCSVGGVNPGPGGGGDLAATVGICPNGAYTPVEASANFCTKDHGFSGYSHPVKTDGTRNPAYHCCAVDPAIGSCPLTAGLRGAPSNTEKGFPEDEDGAKNRCKNAYGANSTGVARPQGGSGFGWCCKVPSAALKCIAGYEGPYETAVKPDKCPGKHYIRGGSKQYCCPKDGSNPVPPPAPPSKEKTTFTVKYSVNFNGILSRRFGVKFMPRICWMEDGASKCAKYSSSSGNYRYLNIGGGLASENVEFVKLTANNFTIKCDFEKGDERIDCKDIHIKIPENAKGSCEYVFEMGTSGLTSHGPKGCPAATASSLEQLGALDMNGDGSINTIDLQYVYDGYIQPDTTDGAASMDFNSDGKVNALDLSLFFGAYGTELE